jgi:hypothetical protein
MTVLPKLAVQNKHQRMDSLNGLRIMRYRPTMFGSLMRHTSTWVVWLINIMCDFEHQSIHVCFIRRCIMYREIECVTTSSHGLLGPIFFEETVKSERYLSMLRNTFVPHLPATGLPLQDQWFMQDGVRPHTANVVLDFLHDSFDSRIISYLFPDCFSCDVTTFFGDFLKKRFFRMNRAYGSMSILECLLFPLLCRKSKYPIFPF